MIPRASSCRFARYDVVGVVVVSFQCMSSLAEQYNTVPTTLLQMSHEAAEGWSGIQWETPLYIVSCINIICCFLTSTPHYPSAIRWSPTRECFLLCSCSASFSCHLVRQFLLFFFSLISTNVDGLCIYRVLQNFIFTYVNNTDGRRDGDEGCGGEDMRVSEPQVRGAVREEVQLRQRVPDGGVPRRGLPWCPAPQQVLLHQDLLNNY